MGLDGGTIISRTDVLRGSSWRASQSDPSRSTRGGAVSTSTVYKEPELTANEERISEQPLQEPIVADELGRLYNKDAVLEFLLCRRAAVTDTAAVQRFENQLRVAGTAVEHIRSLRDLCQLHLSRGSSSASATHEAGASGGGGAAVAKSAAPAGAYVCPITLLPAGGPHPFAALRGCGHVFSERAIKAIAGAACPTCSRPIGGPENVIPLCPSKERAAQLRAALAVRRREKPSREGPKSGRPAGKRQRAE